MVQVEQTGVTSGSTLLAHHCLFCNLSQKIATLSPISGDYCGSTTIDAEFKSYLEALLGPETWRSLAIQEKEMMFEAFVEQKERFDINTYEDNFNIRLARDNIPCPGKKGGFLPISRYEFTRLIY